MKEIHLIPNDEEDHETGMTCWCSPRADYPSDDVILVTHYKETYGLGDGNIDCLVEELANELNYGGWGIYIVGEE